MKIFAPRFLRLTAPLLGAAVLVAHAGEKIEFSGESTKAVVPKPGSRLDDIEGRLGPLPSGGNNAGSAVDPGVVPPQTPTLNKRALEKFLLDYDKKRNWMVPGAQKLDGGLDEREKTEIGDLEKKEKTVLEKYFEGESRTRRGDGLNSKDPDRERSDDDRDNLDVSADRDRETAEERAALDREHNGFRDFNLRAFINPGQNQIGSTDTFVVRPDANLRSMQSFGDRSPKENRRLEQEREAARAAEFQQLIRPRSQGAPTSAFNDPINSQASDVTRREIIPVNPVMPRSESPMRDFASPAPRSSPLGDSGMFGVATPAAAASSITPSFTPPPTAPVFQGNFAPGSIIHERVKRPF